MFYWWHPAAPWSKPMKVRRIEPGVRYRAMFYDPRTGAEHPLGVVKPDARGAEAFSAALAAPAGVERA